MMEIERFCVEDYRSGSYRKVLPGSTSEYEAFVPSLVSKNWIWNDPELNLLLERANLAIGKLDSFACQIPNVDVYIKTHVRVEANSSNKIEGTRTTIKEDLTPVEDVDPEKRDDWREVNNYVDALHYGIEEILSEHGLPLCNRLIRNMHQRLLASVRGEHKTPGEFRISQNWIGGGSIREASYVPPPADELPELLNDLENFLTNDALFVPSLVRCAIFHYQFETIHPFLDGNGRIGRLIIPLFLLSQKVLTKPCFYISDYFERRRVEYVDALQRARLDNDLLGWIKFFLKASIETAESAYKKFDAVCALVDGHRQIVLKLGVKNAVVYQKVLDAFYERPLLTVKELAAGTQTAPSTINTILKRLEEKSIVRETTGYSRNKNYLMSEYLKIFETT